MRNNYLANLNSVVLSRQKLPEKKMFAGNGRAFLLFSLVCWLAGIFALAGNAAQASPSQEWVTLPAVAPRLEQRIFHSAAANTEVSYHVFTPEIYDGDKTRRFSVIYWLHGHGGGEKGLPKLVEFFDRAMREGKLPPTLIVFPNGMAESMWSNSKDGKVPMETVLIDELIPQVDAAFRTIASRSGRLIEGFSMGGYGAARLGFKYPEIFGAMSILGAGPMQRQFDASTGPSDMATDRVRALQNVYGNDQEYFLAQSPWVIAERNADAVRGRSKIRIVVGKQDGSMGSNKDFADHLSRLKISYDFHSLPNVGHKTLQIFDGLGEANWDFYRVALGGEASKVDDKAADETTKSEPKYDAAPKKNYPAQGNMQRRHKVAERLRQFDYDGDGVINLSDLPPPARERFQRLDTNLDGRIDASEMSSFMQ